MTQIINNLNKNKMSKEIVNVTEAELVEILKEIKGPTPATVVATTVVKMNKRGNPYYNQVMKTQESNVFINFNYANSVNKRLLKEGKEANFVPKERAWGVKVPGTPIVEHKGANYIEAGFLTNNKPKVSYTFEGKEISKEMFEDFLPKSSGSKSQGLEDEVVMRTFKADGVDEMRFGGKIYKVQK